MQITSVNVLFYLFMFALLFLGKPQNVGNTVIEENKFSPEKEENEVRKSYISFLSWYTSIVFVYILYMCFLKCFGRQTHFMAI